MMQTFERTEVREAVLALASAAQQPGFRRMLEEVRAARGAERIDTFLRLMNVREMRARGLRLPHHTTIAINASSHETLDLTAPEPPPQAIDFEVCLEVNIPLTPFKASKCWTITIDIDIDID
jgi:hypothetical protein